MTNHQDDDSSQQQANSRVGSTSGGLQADVSLFPIDRYKPIKQLGQGALGRVFLCDDTHLNKQVAVKCLHLSTADHVMSFQQEARIVSRLNHDNVIKLLDFGTSKSGQPYMVMEYFDGRSLQEIIAEKGKVAVSPATEIFLQVCSALKHLHGHNVYHRDLKPSNILVKFSDSGMPWIKLIDFGLSKSTVQDRSGIEVQGRTIVGTPAYMSPDQVEGNVFDATSEIYSLGCVLHEMYSGQPPFVGDTALEILNKHIHETPPPLSASTPDAPPAICRIITKCLEKDRKKRFRSVAEILDAWNDIQSSSSTTDATTVSTPAVKSQLRWMPVFAVLILVLSFTVATLSIRLFSEPEKNSKHTAVRFDVLPAKIAQPYPDFQSPRSDRVEKSEKSTESLYGTQSPDVLDDVAISANKTLDSKADDRDSLVLRYLIDEQSIKKLAHRKSLRHLDISQASVTDSVFSDLAVLPNLSSLVINRTNVKTLDGIEKLINLVRLDLKNTAINDDSLSKLKSLKKLESLNLTATAITDAGVSHLTDIPSLGNLGLSSTLISPAVADILVKIPRLYRVTLANTSVDEQAVRKIAALKTLQFIDINGCEKIADVSNLERDFPTVNFEPNSSFVQTLYNESLGELKKNNLSAAKSKLILSQRLLEKRFGKDSPKLIPFSFEIARIEIYNRQYEKARQILDYYKPMVEKGQNQDNMLGMLDLTSLIFNMTEPVKSVPITTRAIKLAEQLHRPPLELANRYFVLGDLYVGQKRWKDAEAAHKKSVAYFEKSPEARSKALGRAYVHLAESLRILGREDKATELYQKALAILNTRDATSTERREIGIAYVGLSAIDFRKGRYAEALQNNDEANRFLKNATESIVCITGHAQRLEILTKLGRKKEAAEEALLVKKLQSATPAPGK